MTEEELRRLISQTVKEAVDDAMAENLLKLGIDVDEPLEIQRDMQHLRTWRHSVATVKKQSLTTAIAVITVGILGLIWLAVKGGTNG